MFAKEAADIVHVRDFDAATPEDRLQRELDGVEPGGGGSGPSGDSSELDDLPGLPIGLQDPITDPPTGPPLGAESLQGGVEPGENAAEKLVAIVEEARVLDEIEIHGDQPGGLLACLQKRGQAGLEAQRAQTVELRLKGAFHLFELTEPREATGRPVFGDDQEVDIRIGPGFGTRDRAEEDHGDKIVAERALQ